VTLTTAVPTSMMKLPPSTSDDDFLAGRSAVCNGIGGGERMARFCSEFIFVSIF
jgi:hypothetical protein